MKLKGIGRPPAAAVACLHNNNNKKERSHVAMWKVKSMNSTAIKLDDVAAADRRGECDEMLRSCLHRLLLFCTFLYSYWGGWVGG